MRKKGRVEKGCMIKVLVTRPNLQNRPLTIGRMRRIGIHIGGGALVLETERGYYLGCLGDMFVRMHVVKRVRIQ
jgi:hypothetical protein